MNASNVNWLGKRDSDKKIKQGVCIFPFKHEGKMHNKCIKTTKGVYVPQKLLLNAEH